MSWKKIGEFVSKHAPMLGGLLGGPSGAAVGNIIASTLGTEPTPEAVEKRLKEDPDLILKIKELEATDAQHLREMQYRTMAEELKDVQHARESHKDHWMPAALTVLLIIMVSSLTYGLMTLGIEDKARDVVVFIAGQVVNAFMIAVAFWLGSSRGSQEKAKQLGQRP